MLGGLRRESEIFERSGSESEIFESSGSEILESRSRESDILPPTLQPCCGLEMSQPHIFMTRTDPYPPLQTHNPTRTRNPYLNSGPYPAPPIKWQSS